MAVVGVRGIQSILGHVGQTGGHGDMRPGFDVCACAGYRGPITAVADGVDEVRRAVREELRHGATQIKLMVSGGVLSPSDPVWMDQYSDDEIRAAVEETATRRTCVMAHAHPASAVKRSRHLRSAGRHRSFRHSRAECLLSRTVE